MLAPPVAARAPFNLSGPWTIRMMPDFKGNQTIETCTIRQQGRRLSVRFGSHGAELVGVVTDRHAEWHRRLDSGALAVFNADIGDTAKTMTGAWRLQFKDGFEARGGFSGDR